MGKRLEKLVARGLFEFEKNGDGPYEWGDKAAQEKFARKYKYKYKIYL